MYTSFQTSIPFHSEKAKSSLLECLVDDFPLEARDSRSVRTTSPEEMEGLIRRDLLWLFNTRTPIGPEEFDTAELTVLEYGIPDFGGSFPANPADRVVTARRLKRGIDAYEPRLSDVRVKVWPIPENEKRLAVTIEADMLLERTRVPFSFDTILDDARGQWRTREPS